MLSKNIKKIAVIALLLSMLYINSYAQTNANKPKDEDYGNTLNLSVGIGYYGYLGGSTPFFFANYEFTVAPSFTIAPFIGYGHYQSSDYDYGGYGYYYTETIIPIGAKGTYYFDKLLHANPKWDFYAALSLGYTYSKVTWQDGYTGNTDIAPSVGALYYDIHIGAEYHLNKKLGLFLDLSSGVSTVGLAIHSH